MKGSIIEKGCFVGGGFVSVTIVGAEDEGVVVPFLGVGEDPRNLPSLTWDPVPFHRLYVEVGPEWWCMGS